MKDRARNLLADAGFATGKLVREFVHPNGDDSDVVLELETLNLRFVREQGEEFLELGPAEGSEFYQFSDVELAMGWMTVDEIWKKDAAEPLPAVVGRLKSHWASLTEAFAAPRLTETLSRLNFATRRSGAASLDRLLQRAEDAPKGVSRSRTDRDLS